MDLRQLRTFLQVAESGSVSKAAERLNIAQPALTRQIRLLEESLQDRLFDRHSRGVTLTEAGHLFRPRAEAILREVDNTRDEFRARSGRVSGTVRLAVAPALTDFLLGPLVALYRRNFPDVTLELAEGFTGLQEEWLAEGRVDLAIVYDPHPDRRIRSETLLRERLYAIGPGDEFAHRQTLDLAELGARPLITAGRGQRLREVVEDAAARAGVPLSIAFEANALGVQKSLVRQGLGVAVLPLGAVQGDIAQGVLSAAPLAGPEIIWPVAIARPAQNRPSIATASMMETIRGLIGELAEGNSYPGLVRAQV